MRSVLVFDAKNKERLLQEGYKVVSAQKAVNGQTVWTMVSNGLSFDIQDGEAVGLSVADNLRLQF